MVYVRKIQKTENGEELIMASKTMFGDVAFGFESEEACRKILKDDGFTDEEFAEIEIVEAPEDMLLVRVC